MDPSQFLKGRTRETAIRRDARGRWFNGEDPITHPLLVRSFDGWIDLAEDGRYCLSNDINWAYIEVEGPPYLVRTVRVDAAGATLALSGDLEERLATDTLMTDADGALWCRVRGGRVPARFDNHAAAQLAEHAAEDSDGVHFVLGGAQHRPESVADPLSPRDA